LLFSNIPDFLSTPLFDVLVVIANACAQRFQAAKREPLEVRHCCARAKRRLAYLPSSWPGKSAKRVFALDVPAIHVLSCNDDEQSAEQRQVWIASSRRSSQ
jgi:hypothetical protein